MHGDRHDHRGAVADGAPVFNGRIAGYIIEMEQEATLLLDTMEGRPVPGGTAAAAPVPAGNPAMAKG